MRTLNESDLVHVTGGLAGLGTTSRLVFTADDSVGGGDSLDWGYDNGGNLDLNWTHGNFDGSVESVTVVQIRANLVDGSFVQNTVDDFSDWAREKITEAATEGALPFLAGVAAGAVTDGLGAPATAKVVSYIADVVTHVAINSTPAAGNATPVHNTTGHPINN